VVVKAVTRKEHKVVGLLLEWHKQHRRLFPWRVNPDPYRVLVAEVLLQRTPANRVAKFFPEFVGKFPDPRSVSLADLGYLRDLLQPMGLKKRADWLLKLMKVICEKHSCRVPDSEKELLELPGVGSYTASAVICFGFGHDVPIIDVNVVRILSRVFVLPRNGRTRSDVLKQTATKMVPQGNSRPYNEALLDLAALICKKHPLCDLCPIAKSCHYFTSRSN